MDGADGGPDAGVRPDASSVKIFRPYRDVRFAKDKTPYKTHQGAYVAVAPSTGWYVAGVRRRRPHRSRVLRGERRRGWRRSATPIASDLHRPGAGEDPRQAREVRASTIGGDRLKTTPRGYDADHPRIELLRHKSLTVGRELGFGPEISHAGAARPGPQGLARLPAARRVGRQRHARP